MKAVALRTVDLQVSFCLFIQLKYLELILLL
jgi:hypothetical protein